MTRPTQPVTSREVARYAGVAQATVSAVLSGRRYVSPELKARVLAAIDELGYRPNSAARALKTGQSGVVGVLVPNVLSPFWSGFMRAAGRAAAEHRRSLLLSESEEDDSVERATLRMLLERQIDGLLVVVRGTANQDLIEDLARRRLPAVLVYGPPADVPLDAVTVDDEEGAYSGTAHLLQHGRTRIGLVNLPEQRFGSANRLAGFRRALAAHGVAFDPALVQHAGFSEADGYAATRELLGRGTPPDAILVANHLMSIGALHAAAEAGVRVPDDLAIVGFDDTPWAAWTLPPLTLVDQPRDALAVRAFRMLLRRIERLDGPLEQHVLPTRLILRRSCGCPYALGASALRAVDAGRTLGTTGGAVPLAALLSNGGKS
jgi:LacI family transcriptional regulator